MRNRIIDCSGVAFTFLAAGCGGGEAAYSPFATRDCINTHSGMTITKEKADLDYLAMEASDAYGVAVGGNFATVAFNRTPGDAKRMQGAYKVFGTAFDSPVDDILSTKGNVIVLWENTPTDEQMDPDRRLLEDGITTARSELPRLEAPRGMSLSVA